MREKAPSVPLFRGKTYIRHQPSAIILPPKQGDRGGFPPPYPPPKQGDRGGLSLSDIRLGLFSCNVIGNVGKLGEVSLMKGMIHPYDCIGPQALALHIGETTA